jgi:hypothetical protein
MLALEWFEALAPFASSASEGEPRPPKPHLEEGSAYVLALTASEHSDLPDFEVYADLANDLPERSLGRRNNFGRFGRGLVRC